MCGLKRSLPQPWPGGSVDWSVVLTPKGCGFDSPSGHLPRFQVPSLVERRSNQFASHINVSPLPPQINKNISSREDFLKSHFLSPSFIIIIKKKLGGELTLSGVFKLVLVCDPLLK